MEYDNKVLVRTRDAGVFFGTLEREVEDRTMGRITDARRIWYWDGAASLSELATKGTSKPDGCKFPAAVPWIDVTGIIEVLPVSVEAAASMDAVPVWTA